MKANKIQFRNIVLILICITLLDMYFSNKQLFYFNNKSFNSLQMKLNPFTSNLWHSVPKKYLSYAEENLSNITTANNKLVSTMSTHEDQLQKSLSQATTKYYIVMYPGDWIPNNNIVPSQCGNCELTYDKTKVNDNLTKAVIFHFDQVYEKNFPQNRRSDQYYVWYDWESPVALRIVRGMTLTEHNNFFNLTMNYKSSSDIYFPIDTAVHVFEKIRAEGSGNASEDVDVLMKKKQKMALWVVSNCGITPFAKVRLAYSTKLIEAGLDLDRRGSCFAKPVARGSNAVARDSNRHFLGYDYVSKYKFYMAFENALNCSEYITAKLFDNSLYHGVVPVVMGARKSDYEKIAPKHSFIHVNDFETPKKLVEYLCYLDRNETAYREYLAWRLSDVEEMPNYGRATSMCQLCRVIHGINIDNIYHPWYGEKHSDIPLFGFSDKPRIVPSLSDWFYGQDDRECLNA